MEKEEQRNLYEGMYIISATLSDKARQDALERLKQGITSRGGEIKMTHELGRKKIAYEMSGHREGHYYLLYFEVVPSALKSLWRDYRLNEDLVRFMTLRTETVLEKLEFPEIVEVQ